jgi:DNA-directed RNA polymerase specialized sigma24 family protein
MENEEKKILLRQALATIGEQCRKLLELWQLSYSMEEIATTLGISDVDNVRKNRYRCHQKLVTSIKSNPALENALRE